jgi:diacylglycerol O-acyltransferase
MKRLSGWDALILYSETSNVHQHTIKVAVVDPSGMDEKPTVDFLRDILRRRLHRLDPLCYQLVHIPFHLHRPMWREHVEVDLNYHVRAVSVPGPGGRRELNRIVGDLASTPLRRDRPLWEMYLAEGLADGRVAVIAKVHHALADGVASSNLLALAVNWSASTPDERDGYTGDPPPSTVNLLAAAGRDHLRQIRALPKVVRQSASGIVRMRRRARRRRPDIRLARPFRPPATFLNHKLSPRRTFATATVSLAEAKQTAKALGITLNDLVIASAAGALRELLISYDGHADEPLIAQVPVSIDRSPHRISGNALSALLVSLPVHVSDVIERIRLTSIATRIAKENHELLGPSTIATLTDYVPAALIIAVSRLVSLRHVQNKMLNLTISNVPGPSERGRIAGALITEFYSVGPPAAGSGLNITVWSYADQFNITAIADDLTLSEPHRATDAMVHAFAEIRQAAGLDYRLTEVATAMA